MILNFFNESKFEPELNRKGEQVALASSIYFDALQSAPMKNAKKYGNEMKTSCVKKKTTETKRREALKKWREKIVSFYNTWIHNSAHFAITIFACKHTVLAGCFSSQCFFDAALTLLQFHHLIPIGKRERSSFFLTHEQTS